MLPLYVRHQSSHADMNFISYRLSTSPRWITVNSLKTIEDSCCQGCSAMQNCKFTDVSQVLAVYVIKVMITLMEAARSSDMFVNIYQTAWCYNIEDRHFHTHHHENLKFCLITIVCRLVQFVLVDRVSLALSAKLLYITALVTCRMLN